MPNIFDFLRMKNLFDRPPEVYGNDLPEQGGITGQMPRTGIFAQPQEPSFPSRGLFPPSNFQVNMNPEDDNSDASIMASMNRLYAPEHTASDAFNQAINQYPAREKPSFGRRLGAALSAFGPGGYEAGKEVLDKPFREKQEDWIRKIGPMGQAAGIERQSNTNERLMAYQTIASQLRDNAQRAKEANDFRRSQIAEHRAQIYEFKALHPGAKFDFSGTTVMVADPITKEVKDTGVPTTSMSKMDVMNLQQYFKSENIAQQGEENRRLEGVRQGGREQLAETRGWKAYNVPDPDNPGQMKGILVNEITGEEKQLKGKANPLQRPTGATQGRVGGGLTPIQINRQRNNRAREIRDSMPDLAQWIKLKGSNDFEVSARTPPEIRKMIIRYIDGDIGGIDVSQPGRTGATPTPKPAPSKWNVTIR